jgi:hypothetical protein
MMPAGTTGTYEIVGDRLPAGTVEAGTAVFLGSYWAGAHVFEVKGHAEFPAAHLLVGTM